MFNYREKSYEYKKGADFRQPLINPIDSVSAFFFIVLFYFYSCTFYDIQVLLYFFLIGSFKLSLYFFCLWLFFEHFCFTSSSSGFSSSSLYFFDPLIFFECFPFVLFHTPQFLFILFAFWKLHLYYSVFFLHWFQTYFCFFSSLWPSCAEAFSF